MLSIISILLLFIYHAECGDYVATCPEGWTVSYVAKSCLKHFGGISVSYWETEALCKKHGAYVYIQTSLEEKRIMYKLCDKKTWRPFPYRARWILNPNYPYYQKFNYSKTCNAYLRDQTNGGYSMAIGGPIDCNTKHYTAVCKKAAHISCNEGWALLEGNNTCVKVCNIGEEQILRTKACINEKAYQNHMKTQNAQTAMKEKCLSLPYRTYFSDEELVCYVGTSEYCLSFPFIVPSFFSDIEPIQKVLKKYKIAKNEYEICTFRFNLQCARGTSIGNTCFWITDTEQTWSDAAYSCKTQDGTLFVPHSDKDMKNALDFLNQSSTAKSGVWLGLIYSDKWLALDNYMADYFRWKPVETNDNSSASLFLPQTVSTSEGSYAAYMRSEDIEKKYVGLCARSLGSELR